MKVFSMLHNKEERRRYENIIMVDTGFFHVYDIVLGNRIRHREYFIAYSRIKDIRYDVKTKYMIIVMDSPIKVRCSIDVVEMLSKKVPTYDACK